jgi:hypothetical protein
MEIFVNNSKLKLSKGKIDGLEEFKLKSLKFYPEIIEYWYTIENHIRESGVNKIEVAKLRMGMAVSFINGIIFTETVFRQPLPSFLFSVFHEFAHQYQFKKYGKEKMLKLYTNEMSIEEGAKFMKEIELVADEFATRKLRELQKYGFLRNISLPSGFYKQVPLTTFKKTIEHLKSQIKDLGLTSPDEINNAFYNWLKLEVQNSQ